MENIKDTLTTVCAWVTVIGGAVLGAQIAGQISLPVSILGTLGTLVAIAAGVTQFLTGKNPNGSTKSVEQVSQQNIQAKQ
jgi:amino acid transporter